MNMSLIIISILIVLTIVLCRLYISVNISYSKNDDKDLFVFSISMLKILKLYSYKFSPAELNHDDISINKNKKEKNQPEQTNIKPALKKDSNKKKKNPFNIIKKATNYYLNNFKDKININKSQLKKYFNIIKKFLKTSKLEKFNLKLTYGFEDAALTGTSAGILAVFKEFLLIALQRKFRNIDQINFFIFPKFGQEDYLEVDFDCIFKVRVCNVITIMANILANMALSGRH